MTDEHKSAFVYEPVRLFLEKFRDAHAANVSACFEELFRHSGVNAAENAATVGGLRASEAQLQRVIADHRRKRFERGVMITLAVLCALLPLVMIAMDDWELVARLSVGISGAGVCMWLFAKILPELSKKIETLETSDGILQQQINEQRALAWRQMEPLNALYTWNLAPRLFTQTLPIVTLDAYFDMGRMDFLAQRFGMTPPATQQSTLAVQSGEVQGNPFVFVTDVSMEMGEETYHGSLSISWTEWGTGADGKRCRVTRYETLCASKTAPKPQYVEQTRLFYGNDAAPDLSFSRRPGWVHELNERQRRKRIGNGERQLEAMTREAIKNNGAFLDMTNKEFDVLFNALDRDHAQQFRLLFTPLAQKEMVRLLTDDKAGFGDEFAFIKTRRLNIIVPAHLQTFDFTQSPERWQHYCLDDARAYFNHYHNEYFRHLYFAFAPLLAIPLYQQHKPPEHIHKEAWAHRLAQREHEAAANSLGDKRFAHPHSETRNILKTSIANTGERRETLTVTAHGFACKQRTEYVGKFGGDGHWHEIPVHWIEYIPVARQSPELRAHATIADAMQQNSYLQKEITAAREVYNDTVNQWNSDIFAWPTKMIVAARAGYTTRIPFTASVEMKARAREVFF
jgi:hypothetical protein